MTTETQTELMLFRVETTQHANGKITQKVKQVVRECSTSKAAKLLEISKDSVRRLFHAGILKGWQPTAAISTDKKSSAKNHKIVLCWDSVINYRETEQKAQQLLRERGQ